MTEHEHMPPIRKYQVRWLTDDRLLVKLRTAEYVFSSDEALELALAITEQLQVEVRP